MANLPLSIRNSPGDVGRLMSRGPSTFKQQDLTRALRGALAAGVEVEKVVISAGRIAVVVGKIGGRKSSDPTNEWDDV